MKHQHTREPNRDATRDNARENVVPAVQRLADRLATSAALQAQLLAGIRARREAIRQADFAALNQLEQSERELLARVAAADKARRDDATALAVRIGLKADATLSEIAARLGVADRERLEAARSELRAVVEQTRFESGVVRQAAERLSAHMAGVMQAVNSALAHAKIYSRAGSISIGPNVVSSLDIRS